MTTPREILNSAQTFLSAGSSDTAVIRTIMSRAYYSVFHFVGPKVDGEFLNGSGGAHESLERKLLSLKPIDCDAVLSKARLHFMTLKKDRIRADYKLAETVTIRDAEMALKRATAIFDAE